MFVRKWIAKDAPSAASVSPFTARKAICRHACVQRQKNKSSREFAFIIYFNHPCFTQSADYNRMPPDRTIKGRRKNHRDLPACSAVPKRTEPPRACVRYDMIYLLTAIGLSPGGRSTVHIYTQTIHRTIQNKQYIEQHSNFGRVWAVPRLG